MSEETKCLVCMDTGTVVINEGKEDEEQVKCHRGCAVKWMKTVWKKVPLGGTNE